MANKLTRVLFIIYLVTITWIIIFKLGVQFSYMANRRVNLIPFGGRLIFNSEVIMNTLIFVPFGVYAGILFKRWAFKSQVFFFFFTSLLIEVLQFILKIGAFDITDLITNTVGGAIGFMTLKVIEKLFKNNFKAQKFINILALIGTAFILVFLMLLKLKMLPVRYQ